MAMLPAEVSDVLDAADPRLYQVTTRATGPAGSLPLDDEMLRTWPSGDLFGLTQNAGMGWPPSEMLGPQFLVLSTAGGLRAEDGRPIALGYHTGHWEVGLLVRAAAEELKRLGARPVCRQLHRSLRRPHPRDDRNVRQPSLSQRCRHRAAATDPLAAAATGRSGRRNLR